MLHHIDTIALDDSIYKSVFTPIVLCHFVCYLGVTIFSLPK